MARDFIPAADDVLCEKCGYVLNGLPADGACPECGTPVAVSTTDSSRVPPAWEAGRDRAVGRFQFTAVSVLRAPRRFFRTMTAHGDTVRSRSFGVIAILPAMLLNTKTFVMHCFVTQMAVGFPSRGLMLILLPIAPVVVVASWLGLYAAVIRLTTLESRYWGMRLPRDVVRRALHYDAVHMSVASLLPWAVSLVFLCLAIARTDRGIGLFSAYCYTLSAAVVIVGVYLFSVYATSMRSLRYANR